MLPFMNPKFVGTWTPTAKIIGDIPDFSVLNVPKTQPRHNPELGHHWLRYYKQIIQIFFRQENASKDT